LICKVAPKLTVEFHNEPSGPTRRQRRRLRPGCRSGLFAKAEAIIASIRMAP
jgi:hypothetical protein